MTATDWQPLIQAFMAALAAVMIPLVGILADKAIAAFERRTRIILTAQQVQALHDAAQTEAGVIETQLQQGVLRLSQVRPDSPEMLDAAKVALNRVPDAADAQRATVAAMARIIVGRADTAKPPPITPKGSTP